MLGEESKCREDGASLHKPRRLTGSEGIWTFVFIDMLVYGMIFLAYLLERSATPALFYESHQHLNKSIGLFNTAVLMVSSWCVVVALEAARASKWQKAKTALWSAVGLGGVFVVLKLFEYHAKLTAGLDIFNNPFFIFYFFMTFVHFLHVIAGMVVLSMLARGVHFGKPALRVRNIESGGLFWHYVDVLWVYIFTMLYLMG